MARKCSHKGCDRVLYRTNISGLCASHRLQALWKNPEFAERHSRRFRERNADPEFRAAYIARLRAWNLDPARNPLVHLTAEERADYDVLKRKGKLSREEALKVLRNRRRTVVRAPDT